MYIEKLAEDAGRKFGQTKLGASVRSAGGYKISFGASVAVILLVTHIASVAMFLWMFRYQVSGTGLVLDRLTQTAYGCGSLANGGGPYCSQVFPPKRGLIRAPE